MAQLTGTRLGQYDIISLLGAGGMGEVYRARDTTLNREVAIKVLLPSVAGDPDRLARFKREAQVLASLNHSNIAHIHGLEEAHGVRALILELVEGEDLAQRLSRGPLPIDEALPIARQIAEALEAAHDHGIIHRDLKPANIKVRPDGTVKVLDFGLARALDSTQAGAMAGSAQELANSPTLSIHATEAGIILGTVAYMSPEQARGKTVDKRSDIWAFGCVLFEMLTGTRAFSGDGATDTIVSVVTREPDWNGLTPAVPAAIRRLLRRCLEKDPKRRLDSAAAVRLEIDDALTASPVDARLATPPGITTMTRWIHGLPWGIAVVALAIAVAAISFAYLRPRPQAGAMVRFRVAAPLGAIRDAGPAFAVAPDGQTIAFRANGPGGVGRLFTRRLDQPDAQPVAGTDNAGLPFWSPDSRSLGFSKDGGFYRTELDGSAPRRLCDEPGSAAGNLVSSSSGTWGARGVIVFASIGAGLFRVPDTGGTPVPVTSLDPANKEVLHASPWFLPDGRHVLFLGLAAGQTRGVIWAVSIDDPARTRIADSSGGAMYADGWLLTTTAATPRGLVAQPFDPDRLKLGGTPQPVRDRLFAATTGGTPGFSLSSSGVLAVDRPPPVVHQLIWMDRVGRVLETIGPAAAIIDFALAPDERRVAAAVIDDDSLKRDLWLFDPQRKDGTRLTFQVDTRRPMWSLDSRHVHFTTMPSFELRSLAVGATEAERFDNPGAFFHFEDLTRDGRYFVFKLRGSGPVSIWIQRVGVPAERRVLVQGQFGATQPRVSPDGRWLAFTQQLPRGPEIFVQPFDRPGARLQVSRAGGIGASWRADSRELYFEGTDGLMAVPMAERAGAPDPGAPQKLFALHTQGYVSNQPHNVEVAANGQKFLVNAIVGDTDNVPIEVTLNWTTGLKK